MNEAIVLESRVTLVRNYADLPFDTSKDPRAASAVMRRTVNALDAKAGCGFTLQPLRDMTEMNRCVLVERRQMHGGMLKTVDTAAVMLEENGPSVIQLGGQDHLSIASSRPGLALPVAAQDCFRIDDQLSWRVNFAFDEQLGYLAANPTDAGTGLRARVLLHLPMLTKEKKLAEVPKAAMEAGLTLTGCYGGGAEPPAAIWQLSNLSSLGKTEQDLLHDVTEAALRLCAAEEALRQKALHGPERIQMEDRVWRGLSTLQNARILPLPEFFQRWSQVRLGAALSLVPVELDAVDALLPQAMKGHLCNYAEEMLEGMALDVCRAERMRGLLAADPLL